MQPSVWARRKSSSILIPLCPCTQVRSCCNKVFGQNSFRWGSTRNCVLPECLNTPGLYSARQSVPYVFRPWPIMLNLNTQPCSRADVHRCWIMDDTLTLGWYICHISTSIQSQAFARLSLFIPSRVHVLSLDICSGVHDGPERWCLTAATLNRDSAGADWERPAPEGHGGGRPWSRRARLRPKRLPLQNPKSNVSQIINQFNEFKFWLTSLFRLWTCIHTDSHSWKFKPLWCHII